MFAWTGVLNRGSGEQSVPLTATAAGFSYVPRLSPLGIVVNPEPEQFVANKRAIRRTRDGADLEVLGEG